jgi:hypothetical protein
MLHAYHDDLVPIHVVGDAFVDIWAGPLTRAPTFGTDTVAPSIKTLTGGIHLKSIRVELFTNTCCTGSAFNTAVHLAKLRGGRGHVGMHALVGKVSQHHSVAASPAEPHPRSQPSICCQDEFGAKLQARAALAALACCTGIRESPPNPPWQERLAEAGVESHVSVAIPLPPLPYHPIEGSC